MTTLMSSTNAQLPKISYIKSIDVFLGTCFVMVFGSLLEYAIVGYLGKRISMRKSRSEQQSKGLTKAEAELKQHQQQPPPAGQFAYGAPFRQSLDPYASQTAIPTSSSTALVPYQRSPSFYFPAAPGQPVAAAAARSPNRSPGRSPNAPNLPNVPNAPSVPNILIENSNQLNSTTASNPDNEPIYNEHTLHPPSLPSLPSNELQCLPLQPRSHSADNYTHYQQQHFDPRFGHRYPPPPFFAGSKYDPKYDAKYDGKYDVRHDGKFDPRQVSKSFLDFNQRLPLPRDYSPYYSSLPFQHPAYRGAYGHPYGEPFAASYGNAFANPSYHPSMSFANKFTHHYPYSPAFLTGSFYNPHYQPFLCYPDYAKFARQPVSCSVELFLADHRGGARERLSQALGECCSWRLLAALQVF